LKFVERGATSTTAPPFFTSERSLKNHSLVIESKCMDGGRNSTGSLTLLSTLLLSANADGHWLAKCFDDQDFANLWDLANSHHVILRALPCLHSALVAEHSNQASIIADAITKEQARIQHALPFLFEICQALEKVGDVIVIKSLDHWPDMGNDLDLFTNAESADVVAVMLERFGARLDERSLGDRLACKWNFIVPGLPELVEVHVGRLGQTGEQVEITNSLVARAGSAQFRSHTFRVPAAEDRVIISTLQRMYRHFYLRLCDIVDNAHLMESGSIDYGYLRSLARSAGLWDGLANYLVIVSEYVRAYRGVGLSFPSSVTSAARFGNERLTFRRKFLRVPLFPQAASFYASEWKRLLFRGEFHNTARLSLLPGLAVTAALASRITGNDKGVW
jgi:Uncharacterised nucleotidyltransferase